MADDLARFLAGQPVRARSLGPLGRFQRWVRRHPAQASLVGVICLALLVSLMQNGRLQKSLTRSDQLQEDLTDAATEISAVNDSLRETIYVQDMIQAFDAWNRHAIDDVKSLVSKHVPSDGERDLRGVEWYFLSDRIEIKPPREFLGHEGEVYDLAVTPDRKVVVQCRRRQNKTVLEPGQWPSKPGQTPRATWKITRDRNRPRRQTFLHRWQLTDASKHC